MKRCSQCARSAMYEVKGFLLCLSCFTQWQQANAAMHRAQNENLAQLMAYENYLSEEMRWMIGLRSTPPQIRIPQPTYTNVNRGPTLNYIRVDRSVIGMLNAGSIQDVQRIDINVDAIVQAGHAEIAGALRELTEGVASSNEIDAQQRTELLDQLNLVSSQAAAPSEARKTGIVRPVISGLARGLGAAASLAKLWSMFGDLICAHFGIENPIKSNQ